MRVVVALAGLGAGLVAAGVALFVPAAGLIVAGVELVTGAYALAYVKARP